jgi:hypothetical protein
MWALDDAVIRSLMTAELEVPRSLVAQVISRLASMQRVSPSSR